MNENKPNMKSNYPYLFIYLFQQKWVKSNNKQQ